MDSCTRNEKGENSPWPLVLCPVMISWVAFPSFSFSFFRTWKIWGKILSTVLILLEHKACPPFLPITLQQARKSLWAVCRSVSAPCIWAGCGSSSATLHSKQFEPGRVTVLTKEPFRESRRLEFEIGHYACEKMRYNGWLPSPADTFASDFDFLNTQKSTSQRTLALMLPFQKP